MCLTCVLVSSEVRRGCWNPGTEVTDVRKLAHECWELDLGALPEQQELLTTVPSPHPLTNSHMDVCGFHTWNPSIQRMRRGILSSRATQAIKTLSPDPKLKANQNLLDTQTEWQPWEDSQKELTHSCISGMGFIRRRSHKTWLGLKTEEHYEDSLTVERTATEEQFNPRAIKPPWGGGGRVSLQRNATNKEKYLGFLSFQG